MRRPRSSCFWDAGRIQEQCDWGRDTTTKNGTVFGTSPPSRCFTMNFATVALGPQPSGTRTDWRMPKLHPWMSLDACAVCWPILTPCKDFWKRLPTSLAEYLARGRKYSIKKEKKKKKHIEYTDKNAKEPSVSSDMFPLYESQELSLSNCYF